MPGHDAASRSMTVNSQWISHNKHLGLCSGSDMAYRTTTVGRRWHKWMDERALPQKKQLSRRGYEPRQRLNLPKPCPKQKRPLT